MSGDGTSSEVGTSGIERLAARAIAPLGWLLAVLCAVYAWAVWNAPIDSVQGVIQKILYVHPPQAYGAYLGFVITGAAGLAYLRTERDHWDRLAISGAEVGVLFCTLMMITGPIWGKGTWGRWWSWDPRLTVTLLLWFVYLAYMAFRSFSAPGARTARLAAVYGALGVPLIVLNYYVIELFGSRSMHPENVDRSSFGEGMGFPFFIGNLTLFFAFVWLLALRLDLEGLRTRASWRDAGERS